MSNLIKVNIATAVALMIVTVLLVTNHNTAKNAGRVNATISNMVFPSINALHNMRFGIARIVSSANELLVLSASHDSNTIVEASEVVRERALIAYGRNLFRQGLIQFQKNHLSDVGGTTHGIALNTLELKYLAITNTTDLIVEISMQPFDARAVAALKEVFEQHEQEVLQVIEDIISTETKHSLGLLLQGQTSIDDMEFQTVALGSIFFVVIVIYSIFVLNALSNETKSRQITENAIHEKSLEVKQRIKLETSLAHSRKLDSLGTLAGGIAHELNNQLLPVMTMSEMIFSRMSKDDPDFRKVQLIIQGTLNARNTVSKISNFSRTGEGRSDSCRPIEVCINTKDVLLAGCPTNVKISINTQDSEALVHMAADDLQGILVNLFSNGVDAMDGAQGEIHITGREIEIKDYSSSHGLVPGSYIKISVQDNGAGISEDIAERVFDPFFTTKEAGKGVGLGMAIVHATIENAGGNIWLESELGVGTMFVIHLPIIEQNIKPEAIFEDLEA